MSANDLESFQCASRRSAPRRLRECRPASDRLRRVRALITTDNRRRLLGPRSSVRVSARVQCSGVRPAAFDEFPPSVLRPQVCSVPISFLFFVIGEWCGFTWTLSFERFRYH